MLPARPTLRCLRADLGEDWDDNAQRSALNDEPLTLPPLHELGHPIVRHAASVFNGKEETDAQREGITGLTNPMWFKAKTARWRGAVYVDPDGQAWLCAAGLRREREASDFYASFMAAVRGGGPEQFLPDDADRARLRTEKAEQRLQDWERTVHGAACDAIHAAAAAGTASFDVPGVGPAHPALGTVVVEVARFDDDDDDADGDGVAEVVVIVTRSDWSRSDLAEHADLVVLAAIHPAEQEWDASPVPDGPIYSLTFAVSDLDRLLLNVDAAAEPGRTHPGETSHFVHRGGLTASTVEGKAVRGLCGKWFVPHQDHKNKPACLRCEAVHRSITSEEPPES